MVAAQQLRDALARKQGPSAAAKAAPADRAPAIPLTVSRALLMGFAIEETYRIAERTNHAITGEEFAGLIEAFGEPAVAHALGVRGVYHAQRIADITAQLAGDAATGAAALSIAEDATKHIAAFAHALDQCGAAMSSQPAAGKADAARLLLSLNDGPAPADALGEALAQVQNANDADRTREFLRAIQRRLSA